MSRGGGSAGDEFANVNGTLFGSLMIRFACIKRRLIVASEGERTARSLREPRI